MILKLKSRANGQLEIIQDTIYIDDISARTNWYVFKIAPFIFLLLGSYQIYSGMVAVEQVTIFLGILSGIFLIAIPMMFYHSNFNRTNKREINLDEIKEVKMKSILGEIFIDFYLKDHSTRRVYNIQNLHDWHSLRNFLSERNVF